MYKRLCLLVDLLSFHSYPYVWSVDCKYCGTKWQGIAWTKRSANWTLNLIADAHETGHTYPHRLGVRLPLAPASEKMQ